MSCFIGSPLGKKIARGFTLIEVLLVVLLMGLAATAVSLSMGGADPKRQLERTALQFIAATEMVLDETILSGQLIGIVVEDSSYRFVGYHEGRWHALEQDRLLTERKMDGGVEIELIIDGFPLVQEDEQQDSWFDDDFIAKDDESKKSPTPQLLLFPSGEITAFEMSFISQNSLGEGIVVRVFGNSIGQLTLGDGDEFE